MGIACPRRRALRVRAGAAQFSPLPCEACDEYVVDITAITETIRAAALEPVPSRSRSRCGAASSCRLCAAGGCCGSGGPCRHHGLGTSPAGPQTRDQPCANSSACPRARSPRDRTPRATRSSRHRRLANLKAQQGIGNSAAFASSRNVRAGRGDYAVGMTISPRRSLLTSEASTIPPGWRTRSSTTVCARRTVTMPAVGRIDSRALGRRLRRFVRRAPVTPLRESHG